MWPKTGGTHFGSRNSAEYVHVPNFLSEERRFTRRQIVRVLMHCEEIKLSSVLIKDQKSEWLHFHALEMHLCEMPF